MNLFHVKDGDRPMFVIAADWQAALEAWRALIRKENPDEPADWSPDPQGIDFVAEGDELLLPPNDATKELGKLRNMNLALARRYIESMPLPTSDCGDNSWAKAVRVFLLAQAHDEARGGGGVA